MGLPEDSEDNYRNGSPITFAHQLKGNIAHIIIPIDLFLIAL